MISCVQCIALCKIVCSQISVLLDSNMSRVMTKKNLSSGFSTRPDTNQAEQPSKVARGLKFLIFEEDGLYYLCNEKSAEQLRSYCAADLRLCFPICKKLVHYCSYEPHHEKTNILHMRKQGRRSASR